MPSLPPKRWPGAELPNKVVRDFLPGCSHCFNETTLKRKRSISPGCREFMGESAEQRPPGKPPDHTASLGGGGGSIPLLGKPS